MNRKVSALPKAIIVVGCLYFGFLLVAAILEDHTGSRQTQSWGNLKQVGNGLLAYTRDHHGTLPPMRDAQSLSNALKAYIPEPETRLYVSANTGTPFLPNPALSERNVRSIPLPAQCVVLYEEKPTRHRKFSLEFGRCVLFLNGKIGWISEKQWSQIKRVSQLP